MVTANDKIEDLERHVEFMRKNLSKKLNCDMFDDEMQSIKGIIENLKNGASI